MRQIILGIETSCDETAAAVYERGTGIVSSELYSQIELHKNYGGVVPELASRSHLEKISVIVTAALEKAQRNLEDIDIIAVTHKPGLPGSLLVGVCFAKGIAWAQNKKFIGIDHLEGHVFSSFLEHEVPFPHLCLTASGGHTALYMVHDFGRHELIGQTLDDAAGEAFDKVAKLMGLGYPGGPIIERMAREAEFRDFFHYPRPQSSSLDFSFSGLKTAVLYDLVKRGAYEMASKKFLLPEDEMLKKQVASSLLVCMKDTFLHKLERALKVYPHIRAITFVGGVACNKYLKQAMLDFCTVRGLAFFTPSPRFCTDNAAMIAFVGSYKARQGLYHDLSLDILK